MGICGVYVRELWHVEVFEGLRYARRLGFRHMKLHVYYVTVVYINSKREVTRHED